MKFTIRDLFLVTAIVALAAGWWVDRARWQARYDESEKQRAKFESTLDSLKFFNNDHGGLKILDD